MIQHFILIYLGLAVVNVCANMCVRDAVSEEVAGIAQECADENGCDPDLALKLADLVFWVLFLVVLAPLATALQLIYKNHARKWIVIILAAGSIIPVITNFL